MDAGRQIVHLSVFTADRSHTQGGQIRFSSKKSPAPMENHHSDWSGVKMKETRERN